MVLIPQQPTRFAIPSRTRRLSIPCVLEDLLLRSARGDKDAFTAFYDEVIGSVFGLARAIVRDPARAEEVAHEVMLEAWAKAGRFDSRRGSAKAWIATMTRRRAIDLVRSEQASRDREERIGPTYSTPLSGDPVGDQVSDQEDHERVRAGLGHLTDVQREAIQLAFFEGLTYRQVAEQLEVPLGTVKTRMRDGLLRLAGIMGAEG